jgi:superfamily II DNA or RNA helicase/diadenosine tetraphosphate (Ap4A) HIT family hydrolase
MQCPFCDIDPKRILFVHQHGSAIVHALWDSFAVSPGHLLLVPARHVPTWFEATADEQHALTQALEIGKQFVESHHTPDGFNIGINVGAAGGQTVPHLHVHLIPRYFGDVPDPRGGVRHVIPRLANYLAEKSQTYDARALAKTDTISQAPQRSAPFVAGEHDPLLPHLRVAIDASHRVDFSVAFIKQSGVDLLRGHLLDLLDRGGKVRIITGDYLDVTEPEALEDLLELGEGLELYVVQCPVGSSFHPKAYLCYEDGSANRGFIGSSNISRMALKTGIEWNYRVDQAIHGPGFDAMAGAFEALLVDPRTHRVDHAWIDSYRLRRQQQEFRRFDIEQDVGDRPVEPHVIQCEALEALARTRQDGNRAGLVVLATGLGKTWLAAFDAARKTADGQDEFPRVLFVAHRDEILNQAMRTFRRVRPATRCTKYSGVAELHGSQMVFASIQTLGREVHLQRFSPEAFDYIVVDEFHHAAAGTYRRLIDYFRPKFLLGLTATPERTDGGDLLGLCQENLVYRCDMMRGIKEELLCPFEYFGVPDDVDYSNIPWKSRRFDEEALTGALATRVRAQNALDQLERVRAKRTIAFCCSQRHADFMAEYFRGVGKRVAAVHSGSESDPRARSLEGLERGELDVVFAVDMFNEGLDIPSIDTVLMLRPTESSIIWLQQFGRGLRRSEGKERVKVVDYIGNHRTFLVKLRSMLQPLLGVGDSDAQLRRGLELLQRGGVELPDGCSVTYELEAVEMIERLLRPAGDMEAIDRFYQDYVEQHGERPTAMQAYHAGYNPRAVRGLHGSWHGYVEARGGLSSQERDSWESGKEFLGVIERTSMTKSYKMLVLLAMLQGEGGLKAISIEGLVGAFRRFGSSNAALRRDIGETNLASDVKLKKHLESNPIEAWTGEGAGQGRIYFEYVGGELRWVGSEGLVSDPSFRMQVRELIDWRLAEYLDRVGRERGEGAHRASEGSDGSEVVEVREYFCKVISSGDMPIIKLPSRDRVDGIPEGWESLDVEGKKLRVKFAKQYINVVRETESSAKNLLHDILRGWYGASVGQPGTLFEVKLKRVGNDWELHRV